MTTTRISVIVPYKTKDFRVEKCLKWLSYQTFRGFEVIEVSDKECDGLPAEKRNYGIYKSKGDILAFIDSDAYPSSDWLKIALLYLNQGYIGVCGPGVLPADSTLLEKASDLVLKYLPFSYRVTPQKERIVTDYPTFNLVVRKTDILFEPYLTGEDTLYCKALSEKGKILYTPDLIVYHYRRGLFRPYWGQISTWGLHRGHLIRLVFLGWLSTFFVYPFNFMKGFFKRKIR